MVETEYAKALYDLAKENDNLELYRDFFRTLMKIYFSMEDFKNLLNSPFVNKEEKKEFIKKTFGNVFDEIFLNFLYVIIDKNRTNILVGIKDEYKKLVLNSTGVKRIYVTSAKKLSIEELEKLKKALSEKFKDKKIELKNEVDEALIGGIQITADDESIDLSTKNSLEKLKSIL